MPTALQLSTAPTLKSVEVDEDSPNGISYTLIYEAPTREQVAVQQILERIRGASRLTLRSRGDGYWELIAGYSFNPDTGGPGAEPPSDVHELEFGVSQPDVFSNLKLRGLFVDPVNQAQSDDCLAAIKGAVEWFQSGKFGEGADATTAAVASLNDAISTITSGNATLMALAVQAFKGIAYRGTTNFIQYDAVYRRTLTAASPLQVKASFVGVGKIWTTTELRSWEVLPDDWWFDLTDLGAEQWLKAPPSVNTVAGQKTQIAYSYTAALEWWGLLYYKHGSATLLDDTGT